MRENCSTKVKVALLNDLIRMVFFILLKLDNRKEGIEILYDFENSLDFELIPDSMPLNFLNKLIMNKQFKLALLMTKVMGLFYNNVSIRNFIFTKYSGVKRINGIL